MRRQIASRSINRIDYLRVCWKGIVVIDTQQLVVLESRMLLNAVNLSLHFLCCREMTVFLSEFLFNKTAVHQDSVFP